MPKNFTDRAAYALRELSRRAGVTRDMLVHWHIESRADGLVVKPFPDVPGVIRFPSFSGEQRRDSGVVRKSWIREAPAALRELVPDFVVPFCRQSSVPGEPLFRETGDGSWECSEDLLDATVRTLSRVEEIDSRDLDRHGRFPASASIAWRHGFLDRPIVDEYGLALRQVLRILQPGWQPEQSPCCVKLSHDIDQVGIPFNLRGTAGHLLRRRNPGACARDFLSPVCGLAPSYLDDVRAICRMSLDRGLHSALYWKASSPSPFDTGYDVAHPKIARVMEWAREHAVEMGVHPGYETFLSPANLAVEVERCRQAVGNSRLGGRQHYLRWSPETWADWENRGLVYDSTVGFADRVGFRAGTSVPYLPWLWKRDRVSNLLEIPLVVMDVTLVEYMKLSPERSLEVVQRLIRRCAAVGGVFTLLWHNSSLHPPYARFYPPILNALSGIKNYDWETGLAEMRQYHRADFAALSRGSAEWC